MSTTIKIVPEAVDETARSLHAGATQVNAGGTSLATILADSRGLPPSLKARAAELATQIPAKCLRSSDAIAIAGIELSRRAEIARIVDSHRMTGSADGSQRAVGAGPSLRLWTQATEDRANAKPGAYFKEISAAIAKQGNSPAVPAVARVPYEAAAVVVKRGPDVQTKKQIALETARAAELQRTGSTVTVAEAAQIADTSGTGIAIAISRNGLLTIGRDA